QWIASERVKRSVVPEAFWYFSFFGGVTLLAYAIHKHDPVFTVGQASGLAIYGRNIWLIWCEKRRNAEALAGAPPP
ncbi:MAG: lipid-A-disaccharide synthase N-terminal domain-containing protein, partial [Rhodospirillaceae bacterium]